MRSGGLMAADWAVITEYIAILQPLKLATDCLQGRGKAGRFGALYEVIPLIEMLISEYKTRLLPYESVDYEYEGAPEDHIAINLRAALTKLPITTTNCLTPQLTTPLQSFTHATRTIAIDRGVARAINLRVYTRSLSGFGSRTSQLWPLWLQQRYVAQRVYLTTPSTLYLIMKTTIMR